LLYNEKMIAMAIRDRRLKLNYTQEYVAFKLNISQNSYSKIELGQSHLTLIRFIQLCEALEIEQDEMLKVVMQKA